MCNGTDVRTAYTAPSRALRRWFLLLSLPQERSQDGRAQAISHWPLTAEIWIQSRTSPLAISGSRTVFAPNTSRSPVSIFAPTPHSHSLSCHRGYALLGIYSGITHHFTRWAKYVRSNIKERSRNHCCRRSAKMPRLALWGIYVAVNSSIITESFAIETQQSAAFIFEL